jgi:putative nucleotidyltransferase with HDIG domain
MGNPRVHPVLNEVAAVFSGRGKQAFLVGGAVRDLLRGEPAKDWDLATDALPEEVIAMFRGGKHRWPVIPTGIKHGTVTVRYKGVSIEVTTFRTESAYGDGRRPDAVRYAASVEEDLSRRDFTMNAAAMELPSGRLVDPFDGRGDIRRRLIRCVGNPAERFAEDGLRPLRAVRFASQLGFELDPATLEAIPAAMKTTARVAPERIRDELDKIMASGKPSAALTLMEKTGLLELILPELASCRGIDQKGFHRFDVLDHSLLACDYAAARNMPPPVRLAALFHDTGKPRTRRADPAGGWTFYQHEKESAALARAALTRLRYPNAFIDRTVHLIAEHMFHYDEAWSDAAVRRFIIRAGEENLPDLYALRRADAYALAGTEPPPDLLLPLKNRVESALAKSRVLSLRDLAVSGKDLMEIGVKPGPHMGIILGELLEAVVEDPELNRREKLLEIGENLNKRYQVLRPR